MEGEAGRASGASVSTRQQGFHCLRSKISIVHCMYRSPVGGFCMLADWCRTLLFRHPVSIGKVEENVVGMKWFRTFRKRRKA